MTQLAPDTKLQNTTTFGYYVSSDTTMEILANDKEVQIDHNLAMTDEELNCYDLVPLFSYRPFDMWTASLDPIPPIAGSNITYQVKEADQAWLGMVANRMGGRLIKINYQDDSIFISSIIVEIEEETLTMFILSL